MSDEMVSQDDAIVIERTIDAPVEFVWRMWTEPALFAQWYGPNGARVPVVEMDVRVGGRQLVCMEMDTPNSTMKMWTSGEYKEIVPPKRLVYTDSPSDEQGNVLPPSAMGMPDDTSMTSLVTVLLEEVDGRTKMTIPHAGIPANAEGAKQGWEQAVNKLVAQLDAMQNDEA